MFDFSDAEPQSGGSYDLIPEGTVVVLVAKLRPGGAGDGAWLKPSNDGGCNMLDFEFTIDGGEFDRRKVWGSFVTDGTSEGHGKAANITKSRLRGMLESASGISPGDASPTAVKARQVKTWGDFDGLRFVGKLGIQKDKTGQYSDKNILRAAVTPDDPSYIDLGVGGAAKPKAAAASGTKTGGAKPSWAA